MLESSPRADNVKDHCLTFNPVPAPSLPLCPVHPVPALPCLPLHPVSPPTATLPRSIRKVSENFCQQVDPSVTPSSFTDPPSTVSDLDSITAMQVDTSSDDLLQEMEIPNPSQKRAKGVEKLSELPDPASSEQLGLTVSEWPGLDCSEKSSLTPALPYSTSEHPISISSQQSSFTSSKQQPGFNSSKQPSLTLSEQPGLASSEQPGLTPSMQISLTPSEQPGLPAAMQPGITVPKQPDLPSSEQPGLDPFQQPDFSTSEQLDPSLEQSSEKPALPLSEQPCCISSEQCSPTNSEQSIFTTSEQPDPASSKQLTLSEQLDPITFEQHCLNCSEQPSPASEHPGFTYAKDSALSSSEQPCPAFFEEPDHTSEQPGPTVSHTVMESATVQYGPDVSGSVPVLVSQPLSAESNQPLQHLLGPQPEPEHCDAMTNSAVLPLLCTTKSPEKVSEVEPTDHSEPQDITQNGLAEVNTPAVTSASQEAIVSESVSSEKIAQEGILQGSTSVVGETVLKETPSRVTVDSLFLIQDGSESISDTQCKGEDVDESLVKSDAFQHHEPEVSVEEVSSKSCSAIVFPKEENICIESSENGSQHLPTSSETESLTSQSKQTELSFPLVASRTKDGSTTCDGKSLWELKQRSVLVEQKSSGPDKSLLEEELRASEPKLSPPRMKLSQLELENSSTEPQQRSLKLTLKSLELKQSSHIWGGRVESSSLLEADVSNVQRLLEAVPVDTEQGSLEPGRSLSVLDETSLELKLSPPESKQNQLGLEHLGLERGKFEPEQGLLEPEQGPLGPKQGPLEPEQGSLETEQVPSELGQRPIEPEPGSLQPDLGHLEPELGPLVLEQGPLELKTVEPVQGTFKLGAIQFQQKPFDPKQGYPESTNEKDLPHDPESNPIDLRQGTLELEQTLLPGLEGSPLEFKQELVENHSHAPKPEPSVVEHSLLCMEEMPVEEGINQLKSISSCNEPDLESSKQPPSPHSCHRVSGNLFLDSNDGVTGASLPLAISHNDQCQDNGHDSDSTAVTVGEDKEMEMQSATIRFCKQRSSEEVPETLCQTISSAKFEVVDPSNILTTRANLPCLPPTTAASVDCHLPEEDEIIPREGGIIRLETSRTIMPNDSPPPELNSQPDSVISETPHSSVSHAENSHKIASTQHPIPGPEVQPKLTVGGFHGDCESSPAESTGSSLGEKSVSSIEQCRGYWAESDMSLLGSSPWHTMSSASLPHSPHVPSLDPLLSLDLESRPVLLPCPVIRESSPPSPPQTGSEPESSILSSSITFASCQPLLPASQPFHSAAPQNLCLASVNSSHQEVGEFPHASDGCPASAVRTYSDIGHSPESIITDEFKSSLNQSSSPGPNLFASCVGSSPLVTPQGSPRKSPSLSSPMGSPVYTKQLQSPVISSPEGSPVTPNLSCHTNPGQSGQVGDVAGSSVDVTLHSGMALLPCCPSPVPTIVIDKAELIVRENSSRNRYPAEGQESINHPGCSLSLFSCSDSMLLRSPASEDESMSMSRCDSLSSLSDAGFSSSGLNLHLSCSSREGSDVEDECCISFRYSSVEEDGHKENHSLLAGEDLSSLSGFSLEQHDSHPSPAETTSHARAIVTSECGEGDTMSLVSKSNSNREAFGMPWPGEHSGTSSRENRDEIKVTKECANENMEGVVVERVSDVCKKFDLSYDDKPILSDVHIATSEEERDKDDRDQEKGSDDRDQEKGSDDKEQEKDSDDKGQEKDSDDKGQEKDSDDKGQEKDSDDNRQEKDSDDRKQETDKDDSEQERYEDNMKQESGKDDENDVVFPSIASDVMEGNMVDKSSRHEQSLAGREQDLTTSDGEVCKYIPSDDNLLSVALDQEIADSLAVQKQNTIMYNGRACKKTVMGASSESRASDQEQSPSMLEKLSCSKQILPSSSCLDGPDSPDENASEGSSIVEFVDKLLEERLAPFEAVSSSRSEMHKSLQQVVGSYTDCSRDQSLSPAELSSIGEFVDQLLEDQLHVAMKNNKCSPSSTYDSISSICVKPGQVGRAEKSVESGIRYTTKAEPTIQNTTSLHTKSSTSSANVPTSTSVPTLSNIPITTTVPNPTGVPTLTSVPTPTSLPTVTSVSILPKFSTLANQVDHEEPDLVIIEEESSPKKPSPLPLSPAVLCMAESVLNSVASLSTYSAPSLLGSPTCVTTGFCEPQSSSSSCRFSCVTLAGAPAVPPASHIRGPPSVSLTDPRISRWLSTADRHSNHDVLSAHSSSCRHDQSHSRSLSLPPSDDRHLLLSPNSQRLPFSLIDSVNSRHVVVVSSANRCPVHLSRDLPRHRNLSPIPDSIDHHHSSHSPYPDLRQVIMANRDYPRLFPLDLPQRRQVTDIGHYEPIYVSSHPRPLPGRYPPLHRPLSPPLPWPPHSRHRPYPHLYWPHEPLPVPSLHALSHSRRLGGSELERFRDYC